MPAYTTDLDLGALRLASGEGRRFDLAVPIEPIHLAGVAYEIAPNPVPATLEISRMVGHGYALHLSFQVQLKGPCMRCLKEATPTIAVQAREVHRTGAGEELQSPYITNEVMDLTGWAREALVLAIPTTVLCRPECAGLCPQCAVDLNDAGPGHRHERQGDSRWSKLSELEL